MNFRPIVLSTVGISTGFTALCAIAILHPPFLKPVIGLGVPTEPLMQVPLLGNALLAATAPQISSQELQMLQQNEEIILIDVRSAAEFDRSHIPGAIHIPLREIEDHSALPKLKSLQKQHKSLDQPRKIVTYCHSGMRSHRAIAQLKKSGILATNLTGGILKWRETVDPTLNLPGE